MEDKEKIKQELEEVAPFLAKIKGEQKESGMTVPENYFLQLKENILKETVLQSKVETPVTEAINQGWWPRLWGQIEVVLNQMLTPKYALTLASLLIIIVFGIGLLSQNNSSETLNIEQLSAKEIEVYIEENIEAFDTKMLVEHGVQYPEQIPALSPLEFKKEDWADYIEENLIDEIDQNTLEDLL